MIINGGSRSNGGFFSRYLMRADHNERVDVVEIRGLGSENIRDAFREMKAIASATRCTNYFYHANMNTREDERLTAEQWNLAADRLESELGLTGQPRVVVEHDKEGRVHRHIVWQRIDADSMKAIPDSLNYKKHEIVSRALELEFGHEPVESVLVPGGRKKHPEHNPKDHETMRGSETKIDPNDVTLEVTALWKSSDSGPAFAAALEERGYILAEGRKGLCIIDTAGKEHSLLRRLDGVRAPAFKERMGYLDRETLPSVEDGRALAKARHDTSGDAETAPDALQEETDEEPADGGSAPVAVAEDIDAEHAALLARLQPQEQTPEVALSSDIAAADDSNIDAVHNRNIAQAIASKEALDSAEATRPGGRFGRLRAWFGGMSERFNDWRGHLQERYAQFRGGRDAEPSIEPATPSPTEPEDTPEL